MGKEGSGRTGWVPIAFVQRADGWSPVSTAMERRGVSQRWGQCGLVAQTLLPAPTGLAVKPPCCASRLGVLAVLCLPWIPFPARCRVSFGGVMALSDAPAARPCRGSLHVPATPWAQITPTQRQHGNIGGTSQSQDGAHHETCRRSPPGSEFPKWLGSFGHADLWRSRAPIHLPPRSRKPSVPHTCAAPLVLRSRAASPSSAASETPRGPS